MSADGQKSKAELRAERRQKQEEQRAAKSAKKEVTGGAVGNAKPNEKKQSDNAGQKVATDSAAGGAPAEKHQAKKPAGKTEKESGKVREADSGKPGRPDKENAEKKTNRGANAGEKADEHAEKAERKGDAKDREQPRRTRDAIRLDDPQAAKRRTKQLEKQGVPEREKASRKVQFFAHLPQYADRPTRVLRELSFAPESPVLPAFIRLALLSAYEPSRVHVRLETQVDEFALHTDSNKRTFILADALRSFVHNIASGTLKETSSASLPEDRLDEFVNRLDKRLEPNLNFLTQFRQLSVGQAALIRHFKKLLTAERKKIFESREDAAGSRAIESKPRPTQISECAERISDKLLEFLNENIVLADEAISQFVHDKLRKDDHVLTYGFSSCVLKALTDYQSELNQQEKASDAASLISSMNDFSVIVLDDSHSSRGGLLMAKALLRAGVQRVEYGCITAVGHYVGHCTKVLLAADCLLANGNVVAPCGSALVALAAHSRMVPVLVLCESHKLLDAAQLDAFVNNDLRDPDALVRDCVCAKSQGTCEAARKPEAARGPANAKESASAECSATCHVSDWRKTDSLTLLNLAYDVCPPHFVSAVITERIGMLPCTSAPIVLRMQTDVDFLAR